MDEPTEKYIIYIGSLGEEINKKIIQAAFITFGEIKTIDIPYDPSSRKFIL